MDNEFWIQSAVQKKSKKFKLWVEKYRPRNLDDYIGNKKEIKKAIQWIKQFEMLRNISNDEKMDHSDFNKVLLLHGDPGTGKTTLANLILKEFNYNIIEHNSSDIRGKKNIKQFLKKSLSYNNIIDMFYDFKKPLGIIMDEIDTLCSGGADKGGMSEFLSIIKDDRKRKNKDFITILNPIICTYNNFSDKKLNELKKYSCTLFIKKPNKQSLLKLLRKIIKTENLIIDRSLYDIIISISDYDYRRMIYILEYLSINSKKINLENIEELNGKFMKKKKDFDLSQTISIIFNEKLDLNIMFNLFNEETFQIPLYIHENILEYIKKSSLNNNEKIDYIRKIFNYCCKSDLHHTTIFDNKLWDLFYVNAIYGIIKPNMLLNKPILETKKIKDTNIKFPSVLNKISQKYTNKKLIYNSIQDLSHINMKLTKETLILIGNFINFHIYNKKGDLRKLVKYMKLKNIKINDLDNLIKLTKLNNIELVKIKKCSSYLKKKIKKLLNE